MQKIISQTQIFKAFKQSVGISYSWSPYKIYLKFIQNRIKVLIHKKLRETWLIKSKDINLAIKMLCCELK